jgi:lipopolysaccharide/colanic/teichoic acid biosynthesis glycosyltransferase
MPLCAVRQPPECNVSASAAGKLQLRASAGRAALSRNARFWKRAMDVCGAALLLALFAPVVAIFAVMVKWHDGGPAFYRRRVIGRRGQFDAFKLRSMRMDADEVLQRDSVLRQEFSVNFKLKNDPRVTAVGAVMRRYSVDELPQLWNVLRGEMSLMGPRMICPAELEKFGDAGWIFSEMKPGLTGFWQVQGRHEMGYEHRVKMELWYAEHRSLALDLLILLKTPLRVLRGAGAD